MLLRVTMQNMWSFYNETTFDMFPNPNRKSFPNHVNDTGKIPLLKHALIYGANGSGKSNFVKALLFLKQFITSKSCLKNTDMNDFFFQLVRSNKKPMKIEIEFYTNGNYYIYGVKIKRTPKIIISEYLKLSGLGQKEDITVFERNNNTLVLDNDNNSLISDYANELSQQLLSKNPTSSVIPLNQNYPIVNGEHLQNVYKFFSEKFEIVTINSQIPFLIRMVSKHKDLFDFTNKVLSSLHITESLKIKKTPFDKWSVSKKHAALESLWNQNPPVENREVSAFSNNRNDFNITQKNGKGIVQEFLFEQIGIDGFKKNMNIATQSDGTVRLLTLIPALFDAINGHVVIIDEVENSMHPDLMFNLLRYFFNSNSEGQLICTTHLTLLQNQEELVRPDELWKVEKQDGNSAMSSFNDYKINATMDIRKGYEEGRYGGVPQISRIEIDE